ncbi:universal stress protein [Paraburkholderia susongensis]|uniref:Nucleotide-binding universal stress protein, UspA family n=1 Tax=Paraburkholderia susongensis TaxID=1515439 RepID=A0A1X7M219_9BURK|nr:universal stress protein [Paraburkholderia susongensis]SMG59542.1 Nucleotide-binding universal stress protein, UspA family [Paraburkholderia susongensis]
MYRHLLVPVDDSDASSEAVGHAVEFAWLLGARITFFHVPTGEAAFPTSRRRGAFAVEPNALAWELLAKAQAAARAHGVTCDTVSDTASDADQVPHRAILSAAREYGSDLILMVSRGMHDADTGLATRTASVLAAAERPVLVCAPEQRPVPMRVTRMLLDEHRAHAAVLHAWLGMLRHVRLQDGSPGLAPLRACAGYLHRRASSALRQGGNGASCLDERLRGRTGAISAELDELVLRRRRNRRLTRELNELVEQYARGLIPVAELEQAVSAYATFSWEHHGREEGVVFAAARRYLSDADWHAIDRALATRMCQGARAESGSLISLINDTWADTGAHAHGVPPPGKPSAVRADPRT